MMTSDNLVPLNLPARCKSCQAEFVTSDPSRFKYCPNCYVMELAELRAETQRLRDCLAQKIVDESFHGFEKLAEGHTKVLFAERKLLEAQGGNPAFSPIWP